MAPFVQLAVAVVLIAPAPAADPAEAAPTTTPDVHLGLGFQAAHASAEPDADPGDGETSQSTEHAPQALLPRAGMRPPSTLDAIRHTRRARVLSVGAAVAVQGAMIVYGILSLLEQQREAKTLRDAGGPKFNPYPR